jgi:glycosyltransferase involved in cell wall biosynthesis
MPESKPCSLSAFFPAYNDAKSLPELLERTYEVISRLTSDYEVIVINDGSTDDTAAVLANLSKRYTATLRVITHSINRGYGGALKSGFSASTKDLVFYTDGDGQYDVRELEALWEKMRSDVDVVNGYKLNRGDGWKRALIGNTYNWIIRRLFNIKIRDVDCDFRLIRRAVLNQVELVSNTGSICLELVKKLQNRHSRFEEVGVNHYPRAHGRSQFFRLKSVFATLCQLVVLYPTLSIDALRTREISGNE